MAELASREFINFFRGRKHDERLLKKLKLKLLGLNKVLNDAENKQITDQSVKYWLDELKDAVYHADDLVDEIATEALRCKVDAEYQSDPKQVQSPISTSTNCLFDAEIESKLEKMIDTLEDFEKEKDILGLREIIGQKWSQRLPSTSLVDESCVYGRENDKEEIMKLLLSDGERSNDIDVVPIVGMGGVGKTTLAQLLYNDVRVDEHFGMKSWVCVSDVFDVIRVTKTVVEAITGQASDANDLNSLQVKLKESLSGKKFLLVLDDVWNENYDHWDVLMSPFRYGAQGSKIIVTTRSESIASIMQTVPIHGLKELSEEDCWNLFSKHSFESGDRDAYSDLEEIGKAIVRKCKGLPLAAKTLGGLLRSHRDAKDWNDVLQNTIWELSNGKSNIIPALRLSYHYLPSHLKRCFAYCSILIKDYEFGMEEMVLKWMAEGFLEKPKNNKTKEEDGYECFRELLSRSLFQRSTKSSCFVMHDLVHDLAQSVIGDFGYRLEDGKAHGVFEKVRHFSYVQGEFDGFDKFEVIKEAKYLRTFLQIDCRPYLVKCLSKKVVDEILLGLRRLRLLSLSRNHITELPHSMGNLIHLRFLDLSHTQINCLPKSVCTLYNLETLLLSDCRLLTSLPAEIVKLVLLRHLDLSGTNLKEMPMQMSRLKDLQQRTAFVMGKCSGSGINELKELHHLRGTISILGLQNVTSGSAASEAKMREKKHLEKLALKWGSITDDSQNERDVLEKLEPHTNLKHLEIYNYGGTRFPTWLGDESFCNIASLHLVNCEFCFSLPPLGLLRSLKELTISTMPGITNVGHGFCGENGSLSKSFESLETLRFERMSEWVEWCILDVGEFSRPQNLYISKCPKLIGDLPKQVPSLVRLEIKECPKLVASLTRASSIRNLVLEECQGVQLEWQGVSSVETLHISNFASLKEFDNKLFTETNMKVLRIENCPSLLSLPNVGFPPMFTSLSITSCKAMQCFPGEMMHLSNLIELSVEWCPALMLPLSKEMSHCDASLEYLNLYGCQSLKSLPLGLFPKLRSLAIFDCINFETMLIPNGIEFHSLTLLERLFINNCNNMISFPCGGLPAPKMTSLLVDGCKKLKALPEQMHILLPSLQSLVLVNCPEIESFPAGGLPSELRTLDVWYCKKLVGGWREWGLQAHPSLINLTLGGEYEEESLPKEGVLPSTLTSITLASLPSLKSLNDMAIQLLGSLKYMHIRDCPQLQSLPEEGLPASLFVLQIWDYPLLKPRCRMEEGADWHKIAHVPLINIDGEAIFDQVYLGPGPPNFMLFC